MTDSGCIVEEALMRKVEEIKDDIESGRITYFICNPVRGRALHQAAVNCALLLIAHEAKWN